jgi:hypothetical protein
MDGSVQILLGTFLTRWLPLLTALDVTRFGLLQIDATQIESVVVLHRDKKHESLSCSLGMTLNANSYDEEVSLSTMLRESVST